jgi:hypothetical protein
VTYRVEFAGGAQVQFHHLPKPARDALVKRAAEPIEAPWDNAAVLPPGNDRAFCETDQEDR